MKKPEGLSETEWLQYLSWAEELTATWQVLKTPTHDLFCFFFTKVEAQKDSEAEQAETEWYKKARTKNHSFFFKLHSLTGR